MRPSIVFINRVYPPQRGATGRLLSELAGAFERDGWDVTVVTTCDKPGHERKAHIKTIRIKGPQKPSGTFAYFGIWLRLLLRAMRLKRADVVVTMTDPPMLAVVGGLLQRFKGARHIHWCQDLYPDLLPVLGFEFPGWSMALAKWAMRRAMRRADKVIVTGRCMADKIQAYGVVPKNIALIPNWPDFALLHLTEAMQLDNQALEQHQAAGAKPHHEQIKGAPKFRVLYAGTIGLAHPMDVILDAAMILQQEYEDIEITFVGDGERYDHLARERMKRGLDNIRFMPYQPQDRLAQTLETGDVHLISMRPEAAGLLVPSKLYAAVASKRPVIFVGPEDCEIGYTLGQFQCGLIVEPDNPRQLADAIAHYRTNGKEWFEAQAGAIECAETLRPEGLIAAWIERARNLLEPNKG